MGGKEVGSEIRIQRLDRGFVLTCEQRVRRCREEVFPFFADALNLEKITPPFLRFEVLTSGPIAMYAGQCIDYRLRLHGLPIRWRTEISVWEPPVRFVDRQLRGPYRWWRHEHRFLDEGDTTLVQDRVEYGMWLGWLLNPLLVARDLRQIFGYRREQLDREFRAAGTTFLMHGNDVGT